jgi:hypothetical protein
MLSFNPIALGFHDALPLADAEWLFCLTDRAR